MMILSPNLCSPPHTCIHSRDDHSLSHTESALTLETPAASCCSGMRATFVSSPCPCLQGPAFCAVRPFCGVYSQLNSTQLAAPRRNPRQETPRGSPRQKVRRDTSGSQIAGQRQDGKPTTHQPPRESESRQTDRQNRQQPPHRSDTSAGESPTQRYAVVPPYRPTHQGGAFVRCPPYGT